jgi:hypothetical protein
LGLGAFGGAATVGIGAGVGCGASRDGCFEVGAAGAALVGSVFGAVMGGLIGLGVGIVKGHETSYLFYF